MLLTRLRFSGTKPDSTTIQGGIITKSGFGDPHLHLAPDCDESSKSGNLHVQGTARSAVEPITCGANHLARVCVLAASDGVFDIDIRSRMGNTQHAFRTNPLSLQFCMTLTRPFHWGIYAHCGNVNSAGLPIYPPRLILYTSAISSKTFKSVLLSLACYEVAY